MRYLLIATLLTYSLSCHSQANPRNLDFEQSSYNNFYPWQKSNYSPKKYLITPDSTIKHSGRYSLRFSFDTLSKNISDGYATNNLPLDIIGRRLRFSAWVLQTNPDDTAGFISCVISQDLGERKTSAKGKRIINAKEWTRLEWDMNLDTFALPVHHLRLNIGAIGTGNSWIDDINIEVDGKELYNQPSFASARGEKIIPLSTQQEKNLLYLCYAWGFLKYFHPQVAAGKYNWDMELFKMIPVIKNAGSDDALSASLLLWIDSLGEIPVCNTCNSNPPDTAFTKNLDMAWMQSNLLSKRLQSKLATILANRHRGESYYLSYRPVQNLDFLNENNYDNWREIGYPNELFRLQFLFRYWNTIQYFYPYKYIIGTDWNLVLKKFIPLFSGAANITSYHLLMSELVNSVNDSHSGLFDPLLQKELAPFTLPVKTVMIQDRLVVTGFKNDSLAKINGLMVGDIIEKINGQTIKQIIGGKIHLVNGSNYPVKLAYMNTYGYITGGKDSSVRLQVKRSKDKLLLQVRRYSQYSIHINKDSISWKILPGNIGLVNMGVLEKNDIDSLFSRMADTRAIIFDIRNYPKSTIFTICKYLYEKPTPFAKILIPNLDFPGTFLWKGNIVYGPVADDKNKRHYKGRIMLLVNENTQSQAEWTAMALQAIPGAITIGSQTSGADGDVSHLYLTGGYHTNMTGLGVFYPDGAPTQRIGIKIDVTVQPTIKGILEKRDEILEKALEILSK
ncbi:MAG: S41 family peptidase [Chitinophagaceae bacterium]